MQTRRMAMATLAGAAAAVGFGAAVRADGDVPTARTIPGHPPIMDFGDGVKVPLSRGAFLTLWDGPSYWLTFGFGSAAVGDRAKGLAVHHAIGAMRYLLLTLAFAPDRLQKVEGSGWRQKVEDPTNYVFGELELPGQPGAAVTDASMGFGNADANLFIGGNNGPGIGPGTGMSDPGSAFTGIDRSAMLTGVNAFCSYVVKKRELSLDDVRARARLVHL